MPSKTRAGSKWGKRRAGNTAQRMLLQKPVWLLELMADSPPPPLTSDFRPVRALILLYTTPLDTHMLKINHYEKKGGAKCRVTNFHWDFCYIIMCAHVCMHVQACICTAGRYLESGQLSGVSSLFLPYVIWRLNSGNQIWWPMLLLNEPSWMSR